MLALMVLAIAAAVHGTPAAPVHAAAAAPARLSTAAAESLRSAILKDRAETETWLKSNPSSYLAAVQRRDFGENNTLVVGREASCDVRIDDPELAPRHLSVSVEGDSFVVRALGDTARFAVGDRWLREARLGPSSIRIGRFTVRLSHQRFPALIVFDPRSKGFARYHGLRWFPVDFSYRFELPLRAKPRPDTVVILSTRGNQRRALRVGWFDFRVRGTSCHLEATRLLEPGVGENDLGIFFRDATSGRESYGLGRYVDVGVARNGTYVLDFNSCYNPACAVSIYYNCPIPPRANRLSVAIRAGEMDSHYH